MFDRTWTALRAKIKAGSPLLADSCMDGEGFNIGSMEGEVVLH